LYKNAVHNFNWGNYGEQAFVDVDSRNYMTNFVLPQVYERTTKLLKERGEFEKAKEVAVVAAHILPKKVYDVEEAYLYGEIVDTLYKVKETTLARNIVNRHLEFLGDQFVFNEALLSDRPESIDTRALQYSLATLARYQAILQHEDKPLYARADDLYNRYKSRFLGEQ